VVADAIPLGGRHSFGCIAIDYALNGRCHLIRLGDSLNRFCERLFPSDPQYDEVGMSLFATACFVLAPMAIIAAVRAPLGGIRADDNGIRIVNLFRTRRLTWDQVREIDINESGWDAAGHNPIEWTLAFRTTTGQSVGSQFPAGTRTVS
jgi:Bacterial PH domain